MPHMWGCFKNNAYAFLKNSPAIFFQVIFIGMIAQSCYYTDFTVELLLILNYFVNVIE
ncbi:hypothetical protein MNB_SUP05-SYMBIONT-4-704 [hydrothermal vent metagenome]|uniref:Uncharacterized protein n=1 Tax=hydrothermal vent metagenome TaxID=652676 RepID=A0A1W1DXW1_9ZZZZ